MGEWLTECLNLVEAILGRSGIGTQMVIGVVELAILTVVMKLIASVFTGTHYGWWRHFLVAIISVGIIMASAVATSLYILPKVDMSLRVLFLFGLPIIVALLLVLPIQAFSLDQKYERAFITFGGAVIACYFVLLLCNAAIDSFKLGSTGIGSADHRKASIEKVLVK